MNSLSVFLIIVILASLIFGSQRKTRESFLSNCRTLRCKNNKHSLTSIKNTTTAKFTNATSGHLSTIHNHLSNLKEQWL